MAVLSRLYSAKIHCNKADVCVCSAYTHTARNDGCVVSPVDNASVTKDQV